MPKLSQRERITVRTQNHALPLPGLQEVPYVKMEVAMTSSKLSYLTRRLEWRAKTLLAFAQLCTAILQSTSQYV